MERPVNGFREILTVRGFSLVVLSFFGDGTESERLRASLSTVIKLISEDWSRGRTSQSFMRRELPRTRHRGLVAA